MSTSGQLITNQEYESYFWVKWDLDTQHIFAGRSIVNWSCGVYCGHTFQTNAIKMSAVTINGEKVYVGGTYSNFGKGDHTIASGALSIYHDADGTKTFTISSFTGWLYANHNYSCNGGSFALPAIAKQALITAASDFTDLDNPSISFSNPGGYPLDVWLEPNPVGTHLCEANNIPNTGTYTWSLTDAERDALRNSCAGTECTIRLGLYTHIGGEAIADYKDKKFTMRESTATKPAVSVSVSLNNGSLPSTFDGLYIQGKSKVDVTVSATGKYNASIQSYSANVDGKTYNSNKFTSDVIQNSGSVKIVGYAKDSRQFTGSAEQTVNVTAYSKPLVIPLGSENAIQCYRSDENGNRVGNSTYVWVKAKRSYYGLSGKNRCALQWRWKYAEDNWDDNKNLWNNLLQKENTSTDEFNAFIPSAVYDRSAYFELTRSYTVQIRCIDDIGEYDIKTFEIPTRDVALHLGRGGKNVSVGTYCDYSEDYTFYSEWKAIFDKEVYIDGTKVSNHVVEEGASGAFKYRKWSNGTVEMWAYTQAGYTNPNILSKTLDYPVTLSETFSCIGTLNSYGGNLASSLNWNLKMASRSAGCTIWVHNSAGGFTSDTTVDVSVYVVGRYQ